MKSSKRKFELALAGATVHYKKNDPAMKVAGFFIARPVENTVLRLVYQVFKMRYL